MLPRSSFFLNIDFGKRGNFLPTTSYRSFSSYHLKRVNETKNLLSGYLTKNEKKHLFGNSCRGVAFSSTLALPILIRRVLLLINNRDEVIDFPTSTWSKNLLSGYLTKNEKKHLFGDCYWGAAFSLTSTPGKVITSSTLFSITFFLPCHLLILLRRKRVTISRFFLPLLLPKSMLRKKLLLSNNPQKGVFSHF